MSSPFHSLAEAARTIFERQTPYPEDRPSSSLADPTIAPVRVTAPVERPEAPAFASGHLSPPRSYPGFQGHLPSGQAGSALRSEDRSDLSAHLITPGTLAVICRTCHRAQARRGWLICAACAHALTLLIAGVHFLDLSFPGIV